MDSINDELGHLMLNIQHSLKTVVFVLFLALSYNSVFSSLIGNCASVVLQANNEIHSGSQMM